MTRATSVRSGSVAVAVIMVACASHGSMAPIAREPAKPFTDTPIVFIAHRGGITAGIPENTLAAFRQSIAHGVHGIEVDLRASRDGVIVILHDETVDRTTDGTGHVSELALAQLRKLDAGGGESVPTYEDVLDLVAGTGVRLLLDIKEGPGLDERTVLRLTNEHDMLRSVIVGVRNLEDLHAFRALDPKLCTLGFVGEVNDIEPFVAAGVDIIRLWPAWIWSDPNLVARVHRVGKPVWVTAGAATAAEHEALIEHGVDGILSDFPALIRRLDVGSRTQVGRGCA